MKKINIQNNSNKMTGKYYTLSLFTSITAYIHKTFNFNYGKTQLLKAQGIISLENHFIGVRFNICLLDFFLNLIKL